MSLSTRLAKAASLLFIWATTRWVFSSISLPFTTIHQWSHGAQENHQQVAIKTVVTDQLSSKLFENLRSEIEILKSLSHRHVTRLIDIVVSSSLGRTARWLSILLFDIACGEKCISYHGILCRRRFDKLYQETRTR